MPTTERTCRVCGQAFEADNREIKRGNAIFCSLGCSSKGRKRKGPSPSKSVEVACSLCGTTFLKRRSTLANSRSGLFFCSRAHKDEAQRIGGIVAIMPPHYGTAIVRDYSFARTEACQRCGYSLHREILQVHHKDRNRANNDPANLVCLCPNCHDGEHFVTRTGRFHSWS